MDYCETNSCANLKPCKEHDLAVVMVHVAAEEARVTPKKEEETEEDDHILVAARLINVSLNHEKLLLQQQIKQLQEQIDVQDNIILKRKNAIQNGYMQALKNYMFAALASTVLCYADIQYCSIHDTYFPYDWQSCLLCIPNGISMQYILHGPGTVVTTQHHIYLQLSEVDEQVGAHVFHIDRQSRRVLFFISENHTTQCFSKATTLPLHFIIKHDFVHNQFHITITKHCGTEHSLYLNVHPKQGVSFDLLNGIIMGRSIPPKKCSSKKKHSTHRCTKKRSTKKKRSKKWGLLFW